MWEFGSKKINEIKTLEYTSSQWEYLGYIFKIKRLVWLHMYATCGHWCDRTRGAQYVISSENLCVVDFDILRFKGENYKSNFKLMYVCQICAKIDFDDALQKGILVSSFTWIALMAHVRGSI